jgi:hypothetical protein
MVLSELDQAFKDAMRLRIDGQSLTLAAKILQGEKIIHHSE